MKKELKKTYKTVKTLRDISDLYSKLKKEIKKNRNIKFTCDNIKYFVFVYMDMYMVIIVIADLLPTVVMIILKF